jgi:dihydroneopterin aldolase
MTQTPAAADVRVTCMKVFVRGLKLDAEIGVHAHEHGRTQPLLIDAELDLDLAGAQELSETYDYTCVVEHARAVAHESHVKLAEDFAERLARRCLQDPRVWCAKVRVEKLEALAPDAAAAGAEITLTRAT